MPKDGSHILCFLVFVLTCDLLRFWLAAYLVL